MIETPFDAYVWAQYDQLVTVFNLAFRNPAWTGHHDSCEVQV